MATPRKRAKSSSSDGDSGAATDGPAVDPFVQDFVSFLNAAPSAYHAVAQAKQTLLAKGYQELAENASWSNGQLERGGRYFYTRNASCLVAFAVGQGYAPGNGFTILGAHTDSPCPKCKPVSAKSDGDYLQLNVQGYGGGLWHTWFDRDLTVAGRVLVRSGAAGQVRHRLVHVQRPILRTSTLAIHLTAAEDRKAFAPNLHKHFNPVLATEVKNALNGTGAAGAGEAKAGEEDGSASAAGAAAAAAGEEASAVDTSARSRHAPLFLQALAAELGCDADDILDFELQLCDTQPSAVGGVMNEFVFSGRLDNLCSSFQCLRAMVDTTPDSASLAEEENVRAIFLFDHEEIGSGSNSGAACPLLPDLLRRVTHCFSEDAGAAEDQVQRAHRNSFVVSVDMAHAVHPSYREKHDPALTPLMHHGFVLKHNANQRYATNAVTAYLFRELGARADPPCPTQEFGVRSDMGCGSTIGPITASLSGVRVVDVGSPQLSMHSIREVMGTDDVVTGYRHLSSVLTNFPAVDRELTVEGPGT